MKIGEKEEEEAEQINRRNQKAQLRSFSFALHMFL